MDKSFANTPAPEEPNDPLDLEVAEEYETEDDMDLEAEADELRQMLGNDVTSADGLDYDDLDGANKTALADHSTPEEEEHAGAVFHKIRPTDMFEQMVSGNIVKEDKVKRLMAMHMKKHYGDTETTAGEKHDLNGFLH